MAQAVPSKERSYGAVITAAESTPISQVAQTLEEQDVGCVVVAEDDEPVGVLTDRQLALELTDEVDPDRVTAGDLMTPDPVTADSGTDVFHMLQTMEEHGIRRLPIVDEDGKLDGLVSLDDVVSLLGEEMGTVASLVESQV